MKQLFTVFVISCSSLFAQTVPTYVPTNGLVGWWPFNGNANDESANMNNGLIYGATLSSDRFGLANKAFSFNGLTNYIEVPNSSTISVSGSYTISVWINVDLWSFNAPLDEHSVVSKIVDGNWYGGYEIKTGGQGAISHTGNISGNFDVGASNYSNNTWHHVLVVFDGNLLKSYINGLLVQTMSRTGSLQTGSTPLRFGRRGGAGFYNCWYSGKIDDIGIWNRALTQQEIANLYSTCQDSVQLQPQNFTAYAGTGWANFKCGSSDTAATYQWQQSNGAGWFNLSNLGNYNGSTSDSLVITGVTPSMNNFGYRCIIESCETDTTDIAILTVSNGIGLSESAIDLLTISPNPTSGLVSLNIEIDGIYELLTLDGRVLDSGPIKKEYELASLPIGVYNLRFITNEGFKVLKIVKNL